MFRNLGSMEISNDEVQCGKKLSSERSADFLKRKRNVSKGDKLTGNADGHEKSRRDRKVRSKRFHWS